MAQTNGSWRRVTRTLGVLTTVALLFVFVIQQREVNLAWFIFAGGLLGVEFVWPKGMR
jgi:hypothetical protein